MSRKYSPKVMTALESILEIDPDETLDDIRKIYSPNEILNAVLTYEGIIGYADWIIGIIEDIYGIELEEIEDE